jgi:hypothetical protein
MNRQFHQLPALRVVFPHAQSAQAGKQKKKFTHIHKYIKFIIRLGGKNQTYYGLMPPSINEPETTDRYISHSPWRMHDQETEPQDPWQEQEQQRLDSKPQPLTKWNRHRSIRSPGVFISRLRSIIFSSKHFSSQPSGSIDCEFKIPLYS